VHVLFVLFYGLFVLQGLSAADSDDVSGSKQTRRLSNKLVIVSDDESDVDANTENNSLTGAWCRGHV